MLPPSGEELAALRAALIDARRGPLGRNPRVGAAVLDPAGALLALGHHRGAGSHHAETAALSAARSRITGGDLHGCTLVVTLEPCDHTGRTPACTRAVREAGISRVLVAAADPTGPSGGGIATLRAAGLTVLGPEDVARADPELAAEAEQLVARWRRARQERRPVVLAKVAMSLDGCVAATDGSSRWITGPAARRDAHLLRSLSDAVLVGTGTVLADDPQLTVRDLPPEAARLEPPERPDLQSTPRRYALGLREIPPEAAIRGDDGRFRALRTRDVHEALQLIAADGVRQLLLEAGPQVLAAFLAADLVDELVVHQAPILLGPGRGAFSRLPITRLSQARQLRPVGPPRACGPDLRLAFTPVHPAPTPSEPLLPGSGATTAPCGG